MSQYEAKEHLPGRHKDRSLCGKQGVPVIGADWKSMGLAPLDICGTCKRVGRVSDEEIREKTLDITKVGLDDV